MSLKAEPAGSGRLGFGANVQPVCSPRRLARCLQSTPPAPDSQSEQDWTSPSPCQCPGQPGATERHFQPGAAPVYRSHTVPALRVLRPILAGICGRPALRRRVIVNETFKLLSRTPSRRVRVGLRQYSPCITSSEQIHRRRRLAVAAADRYTYPE
jgi:hypothetical protein